jgi:hypothetical protein
LFRIKDNAIAPKKAIYEQALKALPAAHYSAMHAGMLHLHDSLSSAATRAGLDPTPLTIIYRSGVPFVAIDDSPEGDELADAEYGTPDTAANPVLRSEVARRHHEARAIYANTLQRELGL